MSRLCCMACLFAFFFFFNDTATTEIYTLSLHDALPIFPAPPKAGSNAGWILISRQRKRATTAGGIRFTYPASTTSRASPRAVRTSSALAGSASTGVSEADSAGGGGDLESPRLKSSHRYTSPAVFFLEKKKEA